MKRQHETPRDNNCEDTENKTQTNYPTLCVSLNDILK